VIDVCGWYVWRMTCKGYPPVVDMDENLLSMRVKPISRQLWPLQSTKGATDACSFQTVFTRSNADVVEHTLKTSRLRNSP
jgi:hypothetical protein